LDLSPDEWKDFYLVAREAKKQHRGLEISLDDPIIASLGERTETDSLVKGSVCGKLSLNIKSNGDITPCGFIPIVIGNIVKDELKHVWDTSPVLDRMRNKKPTGKCSSCKSYEDCLGGCSARALALTGDFNNPDPHCWVNES
jgi:GeoRSP system radical SAM/SPASM protein